jgi:hypothetical protein
MEPAGRTFDEGDTAAYIGTELLITAIPLEKFSRRHSSL